MQLRIQIIRVEIRQGMSKRTGQPYRMGIAQCVYHAPNPTTGEIEASVGALNLPRGQEDTLPGNYVATMTLVTDREGRVAGAIAKLEPEQGAKQAPVDASKRAA